MFIDNWKKSWKFWSVQLMVLGQVLLWCADTITQAWSVLPPSLASNMPHGKTIAGVVFILALVARLIPQKSLENENE